MGPKRTTVVVMSAAASWLGGCAVPGANERSEGMELGPYGFRHDPMAWAQAAKTLDAARVRTHILKRPKAGDAAIIREEIERIYAKQGVDGNIGENTHGALMRLLDLGCNPKDARFRKAMAAMIAKRAKQREDFGGYELRVACRAGWENKAKLREATRDAAEKSRKLDFWSACPWNGEVQMQMLWDARDCGDVMPVIERGLRIMAEHIKDGRHWPIYLDPYGWLECVGNVDHPLARDVVVKMIPWILRAQKPDGSWGGEGHLGYGPGSHTFAVFRALHKWGLVEPLRAKPPLPADWTIGRTIPAPKGDLRTMTWDGRRFWVYDRNAGEAIAVSPADGKEEARVKLPEGVFGIAWSGGDLLASHQKPEKIFVIDPKDGTVKRTLEAKVWGEFSAIETLDDRILVGNVYCGGVHTYRDGTFSRPQWLAGGFTADMACAKGTVWHIDSFSPLIIRSDPNRHALLIDWGDKPFGDATVGLACDGERLWALDGANHRISVIEKPPRLGQRDHWLANATTIEAGPLYPPARGTGPIDTAIHLRNMSCYPAVVRVTLKGNAYLTSQKTPGAIPVAAGAAKTADVTVVLVKAGRPSDVPPMEILWTAVYKTEQGETTATGSTQARMVQTRRCPKAAKPIRVDGDLSEWGELPVICEEPGSISGRKELWGGKDDACFRIDTAWTDRHVYVAVRMKDDHVYLDPEKQPWKQDGFEIRFDARPDPQRSRDGGRPFRDYVSLNVCPGAKPGEILCPERDRLPEGTEVACRKLDDGLACEMAVPVAYLDKSQGGPWRAFRLNVAVSDREKAGDEFLKIWWMPKWGSPDSYPGSGTFVRTDKP